MTGKTHIMVGAAATIALLPIDIPRINISSLLELNTLMATAMSFGSLVTLAMVIYIGSRLPDLDRPGSSIAKETAGKFGSHRIYAFLGGLLFVYLSKQQELLAVPGAIRPFLLYIGFALIIMSMIRHRGVTHSIWGTLAVWYGFNTLLQYLGQEYPLFTEVFIPEYLSMAFLLVCISHLLVDMCSDSGVFLFYIPFVPATHKRIRIPTFIRTGSFLDVVVIRLGAFFYVAYTVGFKVMIGG